MDKGDFKRWRKSLNLSQKDAAQKLGLKRRVVQYYEKGERDGNKVEIPLSVRLACWAIAEGREDYHGPAKRQEKAKPVTDVAEEAADLAPASAPADGTGTGPVVDGPPIAKPAKPVATRSKPVAKKARLSLVEPEST